MLSITQFIFSLFIEDKAKTYDTKYSLKEYINLIKNIVRENEQITKDYIVEHQVVCEIVLNITRIIGYTL